MIVEHIGDKWFERRQIYISFQNPFIYLILHPSRNVKMHQNMEVIRYLMKTTKENIILSIMQLLHCTMLFK